MKDTKKGHTLKLHSSYESRVWKYLAYNSQFLSLSFQPSSSSSLSYFKSFKPSKPFPSHLLFCTPSCLYTGLSVVVPLVLLAGRTPERTDLLCFTPLEGFSSQMMGKQAAKLSLWWWEHAVEAFYVVVDQEANSGAENRGQARTSKGPFLVTNFCQLGLMPERF